MAQWTKSLYSSQWPQWEKCESGGGQEKQTLSETGWESISCQSISKLFCHHRQQIYDNIWAERAEQHIKAADKEGFG